MNLNTKHLRISKRNCLITNQYLLLFTATLDYTEQAKANIYAQSLELSKVGNSKHRAQVSDCHMKKWLELVIIPTCSLFPVFSHVEILQLLFQHVKIQTVLFLKLQENTLFSPYPNTPQQTSLNFLPLKYNLSVF